MAVDSKLVESRGDPDPKLVTGEQPEAGGDPGYSGYPSYGGGSYGGGSRGGYGGGSGSEDQQQSLLNSGDIYGKRAGDIGDNTKGRANDFVKNAKRRAKEMSGIAKDQLGNFDLQRKANDAFLKSNRAQIMQNSEYEPDQQKLQSTYMALRNRMGNAAYGSGIQDLMEGMQRVDDMNDSEAIRAWRQNENAAYNNWYQAEQDLLAGYRDQVASIKDEFSQFGADARDQMSKMRWDMADELSQLQSQYWTGVNSIDPDLAKRENMEAAAKNARAYEKARKAVDSAKKVQEAVSRKFESSDKKKTPKEILSGLSRSERVAYGKLLKEAVSKSKGDQKALKKLFTEASKKALEKAEEAEKATRVYADEDKKGLYLPNVDLERGVKLPAVTGIGPSSSLKKMMKSPKNASSTNPRTFGFVRPDAATYMGNGLDSSRAANSGFSDNLAAFRRV